MPELLTPGVFIQEVDFGPQPIEGVSTSTAGFAGETERGVVGKPTLVTSFADYQRKFGGFLDESRPLPFALRGFFDNGGRRAFIVRVAASAASEATRLINSGYEVALLESPQAAAAANHFVLRVASVVGVQVGQTLSLIGTNGIATDIAGLAITGINSVTNSLTINAGADADDVADVRPNTHAVRLIAAPSTPVDVVTIAAKDVGEFGRGISVLLTPMYLSTNSVAQVVTPSSRFVVNQIAPFKVGQILEFERAADGTREYAAVAEVVGATSQIRVAPLASVVPAPGDVIRVTGWRLDVFFRGVQVETIVGIPSNNAEVEEFVNNRSQWVAVSSPEMTIAAMGAGTSAQFPMFSGGKPVELTGGGDGLVVASDVVGTDVGGSRTGLKALEAQSDINIIAAPGLSGSDNRIVIDELIAQAERRMDRFAVFESANEADIQEVLAFRGNFNSKYAAMYHPWLKVVDPRTNTEIEVPPSGHIIGAYARTDNERGVFKAPANVTLRGMTDFTHVVPDGEQDLLNPNGVNVLRRFDGLGPVIWGARTISSESLWRYVSVRRLFIFIEQSLIKGTRFAVFEPNNESLWSRLRDGVTNFLTTQWRAGALFGTRPQQAFFVKVDETTTTQDDRDNGRVNIVIGIAPVRPAEFVVFQIGQAPQSVIIAEQS